MSRMEYFSYDYAQYFYKNFDRVSKIFTMTNNHGLASAIATKIKTTSIDTISTLFYA